jgi:tetratricopeptide (TPR) repeat protein
MSKNYAEIFVILLKADIQYARLSEHADFVQGEYKACSLATKAYSLAMMKNPKAINLCDEAAEQFKQVLSKAMEQESVGTSRQAEFFEGFDSFHLFYRGFLELSLGQRVEAIRDIRSSLTSLRFQPDCPSCFDEETLFFIKILEQKLGESLIPIPQEIDTSNPKALFLAGQYNKALSLLDARSDYPDTLMLKAACHAMLGRFEDAKECLEDGDFCTSSIECTHQLLDFLQGDYDRIKTPSVNWDDPAILLMLPLAVKGLKS